LEASVQYVTTSVVSLLTIRQLGLLNNQQAIEISKESHCMFRHVEVAYNLAFWLITKLKCAIIR